jgi:hypothetical protein
MLQGLQAAGDLHRLLEQIQSADILVVRTGYIFMAENWDAIRRLAHFLAHGCLAR